VDLIKKEILYMPEEIIPLGNVYFRYPKEIQEERKRYVEKHSS
jgi:hypothetical protein